MKIPTLPDPFDPLIYRAQNPDLIDLTASELWEHYNVFGREEGRVCSVIATRQDFLQIVGDANRKLEIGPFDAPVLNGTMVDYADVLDSDDLRQRANDLGRNPGGVPEIRWVLPNGDLSAITESYDVVLTSHAIEHTPDLVGHLQSVERLLTPGGRYALIIPDRRYCFDHYLPVTSIAEVLSAWSEGRERHSLQSLIEHRTMVTHNNPHEHWSGNHGEISVSSTELRKVIDEFQNLDDYIDVHAWKFDPHAFETIMSQLRELELTTFALERMYPTIRDTFEFFVVLRKLGPMSDKLESPTSGW